MDIGKVSLKRKLVSLITVFLLFASSCLFIFGDTNNIKQHLVDEKSTVLGSNTSYDESIKKQNNISIIGKMRQNVKGDGQKTTNVACGRAL